MPFYFKEKFYGFVNNTVFLYIPAEIEQSSRKILGCWLC